MSNSMSSLAEPGVYDNEIITTFPRVKVAKQSIPLDKGLGNDIKKVKFCKDLKIFISRPLSARCFPPGNDRREMESRPSIINP